MYWITTFSSFKRFVHWIVQWLTERWLRVWLTELDAERFVIRFTLSGSRKCWRENTPDSPYKSWYFRSFLVECWRLTRFLTLSELFLNLSTVRHWSWTYWGWFWLFQLSLRTPVQSVLLQLQSMRAELKWLRRERIFLKSDSVQYVHPEDPFFWTKRSRTTQH